MFMDMPPVVDINPIAIQVSTVSAVSKMVISPINTQYLLSSSSQHDAIALSASFFVTFDMENWVPPVPMTGGGTSQPNNDANFALLNGEAGWVPPVLLGGGGGTKPSENVKLS